MTERHESIWHAAKIALCALAVLAVLVPTALAQTPAQVAPSDPPGKATHVGDCSQRSGIAKARCERHEKMFAKCGSIAGEAHFVCDREYLLAHPLDCSAIDSGDRKLCAAEIAAFTTCEAKPGRGFMRCVRGEINASPMGH